MGKHAERRVVTWWRRVHSVRFRAVLALGLLLGIGAVSTTAYWTDQAEVDGGTIRAGTLDIKLGQPAVDDNPPQFATDLQMDDMVPGDSTEAVLAVNNAGTVPLVFSLTGSATNVGPEQMGSTIRLSVFPSSAGGTCSGTALVTNVPGNGRVLDDQPALPATDTRQLCFRATLPPDASNAVQGASTTITLTFHAKQVGAP